MLEAGALGSFKLVVLADDFKAVGLRFSRDAFGVTFFLAPDGLRSLPIRSSASIQLQIQVLWLDVLAYFHGFVLR